MKEEGIMNKRLFISGKAGKFTARCTRRPLRGLTAWKVRKEDRYSYTQRDRLVPGGPEEQYSQDELASLVESIKRNVLLRNLIVAPDKDGRYRIIEGERRYYAILSLSDEDYCEIFPTGIPILIKEEVSYGR
jgi:hypothetical protein